MNKDVTMEMVNRATGPLMIYDRELILAFMKKFFLDSRDLLFKWGAGISYYELRRFQDYSLKRLFVAFCLHKDWDPVTIMMTLLSSPVPGIWIQPLPWDLGAFELYPSGVYQR